jgi:YHS domain-containing protein
MNELSRRRVFQTAIATLLYGTGASLSVAGEDDKPVRARVAIEGYDPVAYFTDSRPVKGSPAFSSEFDDVVYYFVNAEHKKMFAADPDRYAPQYSGYCAAALSKGYKATIDPASWTISNGKLYVFHSKDGLSLFAEDSAGMIAKADAHWATLKAQR